MITAKIDVTKIEKARLYKGEKGTYLDIVLIPTQDNSYGNDYMIVQSVTKDEREAGIKGAILGNAKIIKKTDPVPITQAEQDDLPF
jgi:hypothetical protein